MAENLTHEKFTLIQTMAWCCQAASLIKYKSPCWAWCMLPYDVCWPQWVDNPVDFYDPTLGRSYCCCVKAKSKSTSILQVIDDLKYLQTHQLKCSGTHFTTVSRVYELIIEISWKFFLLLISILITKPGHYFAQDRSVCHGMCKIVIWFDNYFSFMSNPNFLRFGLWSS